MAPLPFHPQHERTPDAQLSLLPVAAHPAASSPGARGAHRAASATSSGLPVGVVLPRAVGDGDLGDGVVGCRWPGAPGLAYSWIMEF